MCCRMPTKISAALVEFKRFEFFPASALFISEQEQITFFWAENVQPFGVFHLCQEGIFR